MDDHRPDEPIAIWKNAAEEWTIHCDGVSPVKTSDSSLAYRIEQLAKRAYACGTADARRKMREALGI